MATTGKTIQCRAAVSWEPNQIQIETISVEPPKAGEVRIKVHSASICQTDNTLLSGVSVGYPKPIFPVILGHECAGVVESIGEGVETLKPGDFVLPCSAPQCRKCKHCLGNRSHACMTLDENLGDGSLDFGPTKTTRFSCNGKTIFHFEGVSAFSEYTVCREASVAKISLLAPLDRVSPISCGIITGYGSAVNSSGIQEGSTCAVWGMGAVGLAAVMGCKKMKAGKIIAVEPNPDKHATAMRVGATLVLNPLDEDFEKRFMEATDGEGADVAIECVGKVAATQRAISLTSRRWGKTLVVGADSIDAKLEVGNSLQFLFGRTLTGSWMGGTKSHDFLAYLVDEYLKGEIPVDEVVTHHVDLENIADGFELLRSGKCVKTVVNMKH